MWRHPQVQLHFCDDQQRAFEISNISYCRIHLPMYKAKQINPMSQSCRAHLFFGGRLIQQNSRFEFFFACLIFFPVFMNLLVKINEKIYDRHNETLWTTDFFNSVFCLVSCSSKIKFHISKLWPTQIWHICCSEKQTNKHTNKQKKTR